MSLPFENPDTTFDSFLQELPADYHERAIEFKAFTRSRKIKTPTRAPRKTSGLKNRPLLNQVVASSIYQETEVFRGAHTPDVSGDVLLRA
jgi:hypothetical protein